MKSKIVFLASILSISALGAHPLFNPKILAKFSYGHEWRFHKLGGTLAFENEFHQYFSAGFLVGGAAGKMQRSELCDSKDPIKCMSEDLKLAWVDFGLYIKPQYPIHIGEQLLAPYLSLVAGPSISIIRNKAVIENKAYLAQIDAGILGTLISQYYAAFLGVDYTICEHWILSVEGGIQANLRLLRPIIAGLPITVNAGVGYRF